MIPWEQIDGRLEKLGKNRAWLAEVTGRSPGSIRAALAPNAVPKQRTDLLQKALTDAIEGEELRRAAATASIGASLPDRITIECTPEQRRAWEESALSQGMTLDKWMIHSIKEYAASLISAAEAEKSTPADAPGDSATRPAPGKDEVGR